MPTQSPALTTALGLVGMLGLTVFILFGVGIETSTFYSFDALVIVTLGLAVSVLIGFRTAQLAAGWASLTAIFRDEPPPEKEIEELVAFCAALRKNVHEA